VLERTFNYRLGCYEFLVGGLVAHRLGRWTYDQVVEGLTSGQIAISRLVLGWLTVSQQINHRGI